MEADYIALSLLVFSSFLHKGNTFSHFKIHPQLQGTVPQTVLVVCYKLASLILALSSGLHTSNHAFLPGSVLQLAHLCLTRPPLPAALSAGLSVEYT